jgi:hypothetical protein
MQELLDELNKQLSHDQQMQSQFEVVIEPFLFTEKFQ